MLGAHLSSPGEDDVEGYGAPTPVRISVTDPMCSICRFMGGNTIILGYGGLSRDLY